ncbi:hypothetical protein KA036_02630 [Candidatus Gracilibacteria bacterium]|nr:hypothetical protein [Candidatus Gracilibacteria bacterium]
MLSINLHPDEAINSSPPPSHQFIRDLIACLRNNEVQEFPNLIDEKVDLEAIWEQMMDDQLLDELVLTWMEDEDVANDIKTIVDYRKNKDSKCIKIDSFLNSIEIWLKISGVSYFNRNAIITVLGPKLKESIAKSIGMDTKEIKVSTGTLVNFSALEVVKKMRRLGIVHEKSKSGSSHHTLINPETEIKAVIPYRRTSEYIQPLVILNILNRLGIKIEEFLNA